MKEIVSAYCADVEVGPFRRLSILFPDIERPMNPFPLHSRSYLMCRQQLSDSLSRPPSRIPFLYLGYLNDRLQHMDGPYWPSNAEAMVYNSTAVAPKLQS